MAQFPYLCESGFEANALGADLAETDTASAGAIYHYADSVKQFGITPWRGAYCYIIDESICTTTECKLVSAACNVTAQYYWSMGFAFFAKNTTMATGNRTSLVKLLNSSTEEVCLQLYYTTSGGLQLLLTEAQNTAGVTTVTPFVENKWHWIELYGVNDPGSNDGTAVCVVDGVTVISLGSLDQLAITDMQIGLDDQDAGHTTGIYAFDDITFTGIDTSAVRTGLRSRYPLTPHISMSQHLFVGPGTVDRTQLLTATTGDTMRLYDTDVALTTGTYDLIAEANIAVNTEVEGPLVFQKGCYAVITSGARGQVFIARNPIAVGLPQAVLYGNDANLKSYAMGR